MRSLRFASLFTLFISTISLAQNNPVPLINQPLVPASAAPGSGGFTLVVNGTGFSSGSVVDWNGSSRVTAVISTSQLKATITAADVAKAGTARVKVMNPVPGGGSSNPVYFPIRTTSSSVAFASTFDKTFLSAGVVAVRDFNNDGNLDVAVGFREKFGGSVDVYLGNGDGTFKAPIKIKTTVPVDTILTADLNDDGKADILVSNSRSDRNLQVLLGKGDGTFTLKPAFVVKEFTEFIASRTLMAMASWIYIREDLGNTVTVSAFSLATATARSLLRPYITVLTAADLQLAISIAMEFSTSPCQLAVRWTYTWEMETEHSRILQPTQQATVSRFA
jgi:hypothetical protein